MAWKSYEDFTREKNWGKDSCGDASQNPNLEQLTFGLMVRITKAVELMAKNHDQLISDRDYYKRRVEGLEIDCRYAQRQIAGLRGALNRIKKHKGGTK
jgi:hypothetical protein